MVAGNFLKTILLALCVGGLGACAGTGSDIPTPPDRGDADYVIGPGDQLRVYVRNNPDMSVDIPVRPDGKISVPMIQNMRAAGKTPSELAEDLEADLEEFIRDPNVTVMVTGFVGTYDAQIRVIGQAVQPQAIAYRDGMTVLDAVIEVGGLTQFAAGNRARLVRDSGDGSQTYRVRLNDLISNGDMRHNHALRPGDVLVIPEAIF